MSVSILEALQNANYNLDNVKTLGISLLPMAKIKIPAFQEKGTKICAKYRIQSDVFVCDGIFYPKSELTNIRRLPEELWEGE